MGMLLILLKWRFEGDQNITLFVRIHSYIHYVGGIPSCHVSKIWCLSDHFTSAVLQNSIADVQEKEKEVWVCLSCCQIGSEMLNSQPGLQQWYSWGVLLSKLHETNDACLWTNDLVFLWAPAGLWGGCHSVTSLINVLQLFMYRLFYFLRFISKHTLDVIIIGIISIISLSDNLFLMYRFLYINFVYCNFTEFTNELF